MDSISRIGYQWIFRADLICRIWQKLAKIATICLVNKFSPEGNYLIFLYLITYLGTIHMTSMKISWFSRHSTPLSSYVQNSSTPLTLDVQLQTNPLLLSSPNYRQTIKRKQNLRMIVVCYQVFPSGRFLFSVSTH